MYTCTQVHKQTYSCTYVCSQTLQPHMYAHALNTPSPLAHQLLSSRVIFSAPFSTCTASFLPVFWLRALVLHRSHVLSFSYTCRTRNPHSYLVQGWWPWNLISVLNLFAGKDLLVPEALGEGLVWAGGGGRCALSPHSSAPGFVSMSPAPVLCPVLLADKGVQGPLGPLAVPGLLWAEGMCQGPSVDIATECPQANWT